MLFTCRARTCTPFLLVGALLALAPFAQAQEHRLFTINSFAEVNGARFEQATTFLDGGVASGTGNFKPFLRLQANGTEAGHNTGGTLLNDEKGGPWTTDLRRRDVPVVGGNLEFFLDINEVANTNGRYITIDELRIYASPTPGLSATNPMGNPSALGNLVYDMDGAGDSKVVLDYELDGSGSGRSDLRLLVPRPLFTAACGAATPCYIYFWTVKGSTFSGTDAVSDNGFADSGFEEWNVLERDALGVSKTAVPEFTRTFEWDIDKAVDVDEHNLFNGQSGTSNYTVTVDQTITNDGYAVSGVITITNPSENTLSLTVLSVEDAIQAVYDAQDPPNEILPEVLASVNCGSVIGSTLAPGQSADCTYSANLPSDDDRVNVVSLRFRDPSLNEYVASYEAPFSFVGVTPTVAGYETVNVSDSVEGALGSASDDATFEYSRTFTCGADAGEHPNTATIDETGQSDDANVSVACYGLVVSKECATTYTRTFDWDILKSSTNVSGPLTLTEGQFFDVFYSVDVTKDDGTDSDFAASCVITVENEHPTASADDVAVSDALADAIGAALDCGGTPSNELDIAAGGSATCDYSAGLPDATERSNQATATLYAVDYSGSASVTFGDPTTLVDDCANVSDADLNFGPEYVCDDATFDETDGLYYPINTDECHDTEASFTNTSVVEAEDSGAIDESAVTVVWTIPCPEVGCTLTPGYWRTHSMYHNNGKHYDPTWALIDQADLDDLTDENDPFFLSGHSYIEVLWTAPAGNAYYNLSFHYIAALLNSLNGAGMPADVQTAFDAATALFEAYTPAQVAALKGKNGNALRAQFVDLAGTLGAFNEGDLGAGHCDDDGTNGTFDPEALRVGESALLDAAKGDAKGDAKDAPEQVQKDGTTETLEFSGTESVVALPAEFALGSSYPNPFSGSTTIEFALPESARVSLKVYDLLGREVALLMDETMEAGTHRAIWNANGAPAGVYFFIFRADGFVQSRSVTVLR